MPRCADDQMFPPAEAAAFLERLCRLDPVDGAASAVETPLGLAALAAHVYSEQRGLRAALAAQGGSLGRPGGGSGDLATRAVVDEHRRAHPQHERYLGLVVTAFDLSDLCDERSERAYGSRIPSLARDAALCRLERIARRVYRACVPRAVTPGPAPAGRGAQPASTTIASSGPSDHSSLAS